MDTMTATPTQDFDFVLLSRRDRAVLDAIQQGRGTINNGHLFIDGMYCADQFALQRLSNAGLLSTGPANITTLTYSKPATVGV